MKKSNIKITAVITVICLFFITIVGNIATASAVFFLLNTNASAGNVQTQAQSQEITDYNNVYIPTENHIQSPVVDGSSDIVSESISADDEVTEAENNVENSVNSLIDINALNVFRNAVKDIKQNGIAGYTKKHWQTVSSPLVLDQLEGLSGMLTDIMVEVMITEEEMEHGRLIMEKGSAEAKESLPDYNATEEAIQSVTQRQEGENTVITIIMKDFLNPGREDTDGISLMSQDLLYIEDVKDKIQRDSVISALIKDLSQGDILYKAFTVEATITNDGKLSQIIHYCDSYVEAKAQTIFGELSGSCGIGFHAKFYDFKY